MKIRAETSGIRAGWLPLGLHSKKFVTSWCFQDEI
jgi:hypothetical protein